MAQVITLAGERLFALKAQNNQQLDIDTFIFAYVPGQDSTVPIDRNEDLPPVNQRVHTQIVQQYGMLNDNAVVYSSVLDSLTGPFQFNWVGLYSAVNQTLVAIQHIPTVVKTVTEPGASGNILNRNFVIEYSGIAELTGITVDPATWQYDFNARLNGMDELTRQLAADMNGKDWFIGDGFKVVPRSTLNTFKVTAGAGYVSGLRVELAADHILTLSSYPQFVYVDAWFDGTSESIWKGHVAFTVTNTEMDDYIDVNGRNHYVFKLARITAADVVEDLRYIGDTLDSRNTNVKRVFKSFSEMKDYNNGSVGDNITIPSINAEYKLDSNDDGCGILLKSGLYANVIIKNNTLETDWLGVSENQDITDILLSIKEKVKADNVTKVVMNSNAKFSGVLPFEYNQVAFAADPLTGVGKLAIDNPVNILQAIQNTKSPYKTYSGKLNGMLLDNQNCKSAIKVRKEIRVVLLGDSIGVTSDWDSHAVAAGSRDIQGVDNFSTVNSLGFLLFQEICAAAGSDVRVRFYSRCVGGKSYTNLGNAWDSSALNANWSGREQCTPGKAWVDCVLDLEPDLVIHEMGMNHGPEDYISGYIINWHTKLISTGRLGTFDQALMTTPSPNFEDAGAFGDFRPFCTPMFYVALQQRFIANKYGLTLIDVSFNSFLKRYGIDSRSCVMSKDYRDILTSVVIPPSGGQAFNHPNNPIFHQTTLELNQNSGAALDFKVNFGDGVIVQFGKTAISIINGSFDGSTGLNAAKTVAYSMPDNTDVTFTIQVLPHGVFVYEGNNGANLLLVNQITTYKTTVGGVIQNNSASGSVTVKNLKIFEGEFPRYASDMSTIEMYGVLDYQNNPFGGGINHPSNKGLAEVYLPPVREFCTRLTEGDFVGYVNNQLPMVNNDLIYIGSIETLPNAVSEFWDDTSLTYLKVKVSEVGAIDNIDNRTGMSIYYNARGDFYAKITGGKNIKGMHYKGNWRKYGGHVVDKAHAPLRLNGFTEVQASFSTTVVSFADGKVTRTDVAIINEGTSYTYSLDFGNNKFVGASCTITANSNVAVLSILDDKWQSASSESGGLHYFCQFSNDASVTPRRIIFESSYILG